MQASKLSRRQSLLSTARWMALGLGLGIAAFSTVPVAIAQPSFTVSPEQLQRAVATRFPVRYPVGGLFEVTVMTPQLRLLPGQNRLGSAQVVEAGGPALGRSYAGTVDLDFALRYEAGDQSIRAHQLRVNSLRFADLPPSTSQVLNTYVPALVEQTLKEVVLHRLSREDLALADTMGFEPGPITVTERGLVIGFVNKRQR